MKKIFIAILILVLFASCREYFSEKGETFGDWELIIPPRADVASLYRYVDTEYGVVIYWSENSRMTSQKIDEEDDDK